VTVKTTLSFTERHHRFLADKVAEGAYATLSAAAAAAVERMIEDDAARETALAAMAGEIRARMRTAEAEFVDGNAVLEELRAVLAADGPGGL